MYDKNAEEILKQVGEDFHCPNLIDNGDGTTVCRIYNSPEKPQFCTAYPMTPDDLVDGCSYYFEMLHPSVIERVETKHKPIRVML